jgi:transposase InsO family protein
VRQPETDVPKPRGVGIAAEKPQSVKMPTAKLIGKRIEVSGWIQDFEGQMTWDTGAQVSLVSEAWLAAHLQQDQYLVRPMSEITEKFLVLEGIGSNISYQGFTELSVRLGKSEQAVIVPFLVVDTRHQLPILGSNLMDVLLDGDRWKDKITNLAKYGLVESEIMALTAILTSMMEDTLVGSVLVKQGGIVVPARSSAFIFCKSGAGKAVKTKSVLFQPNTEWQAKNQQLAIQLAVVSLERGSDEVVIQFSNKYNEDLRVEEGEHLGTLEEVQVVEDAECNFLKALVGNLECVEKEEVPQEGPTNKPFAAMVVSDVPEESRHFFGQLKQMVFAELTVEEKVQVKEMIWEEREAFAQNPEDIGSVPELVLHLNTIDEVPVQRMYNSLPKLQHADVRSHIQTMIEKGWIRKSESSWSSPIVVVKKKDNSIRLCCDFRRLNSKTVRDCHPIPRISEAVDSLQGSSWFSVLDLSRAYYQGYMSEESRKKTAFVTPWGLFEFNRIPFGLSNAVPAFQRFMERILEPYRDSFALPYLDDTIVHGSSVSEHIKQIQKVLQVFKKYGLKLNPAKCSLFKREVTYLGRIVSKDGYRMDDRSVEAVRDLSNRKFETVGEVRQLLGLLSYHRRHVPNFATIAKPLNDLLAGPADSEEGVKAEKDSKGGVPSKKKINWTTEHQAALEKLITLVTNPPILAYADFNSPDEFFLHVDASGAGVGAILLQKQDGKNRTIAYASRSLKPSERNYHSSKLEFIALKWAVTEQFKDYLAYSNHFTIFTDNNPLLFVMKLEKPNSTIQRWISELGEYNFTVNYRRGVDNSDADCLSRLPLDIDKYIPLCKEKVTLDSFQAMVAAVSTQEVHVLPNISGCTGEMTEVGSFEAIEDLKRDQEEDEYIGPVLTALRDGATRVPASSASHSSVLMRERRNLYFDQDEVLCRRSRGHRQVVLPLKHRDLIYKALHTNMGHLGAERVLQLARQRVYWPNMESDVKEYTQQRCRCVAQRRSRRQAVAPLVSIHSSYPMQLVCIDFLHLEKSTTSCEYILLVVDHFTRYAQAYPTKNKSALTAAKCLFNDYILRFGIPARILHDQGKEFDNRLFRELERFCGIVKSRTTSYHPQGNGSVERMNSTLLQMLRALAESEKPNWHQHVNKLVSAYNATVHSTTGFTPHYLLYGREALLPLDLILGSQQSSGARVQSYSNFTLEWEERMTEAYRIAKQNCDKVKNCAEARWKSRMLANELCPGDKVLVKNKREQGGPGKIRAFWEQNVYQVLEQKEGGVVYAVQQVGKPSGEVRVLHRNMLLPCEMLELEPKNALGRFAAATPVTTKSASRKPTNARAAATTPAATRSRSRKALGAALDGDSGSESSEEDEPLWSHPIVQQGVAGIAGVAGDEHPDARDEHSGSERMAEGGQAADNGLSESESEVLAAGDMDRDAVLDDGTVDDLVAEYFGDTSMEDSQTFTGFDDEADNDLEAAEEDQSVNDGVAEDVEMRSSSHVEASAGSNAEDGNRVPTPSVLDHIDTSDAFGEDMAADVDAVPEEADAACGDSRRSTRESRPPQRYQYFKMGGDPMVTDDPVGVAESPNVPTTNASSVQAGLEEAKDEEHGWVNWIQEKIDDWRIRLL